MRIPFIPKDKVFWIYHCSAVFSLVIIQGLIFFFWRDEKLFNAAAGAVWVPLYTAAVLLFRYLYKKRAWYSVSTGWMIPGVLLYGLLMGAVMTLGLLMIVTPFFWSHLVNNREVLAHKVTLGDVMLQMFIGNTLQNQLLVSAWCFIYITIVSGRRIREAEVNTLRLQNSLKESQLANLSNQLNPHFLFNAINNIRFTIYENAEKADAMLTGLSEMLRYSLDRSKQDKVRLSEELEIIALYIDLVKVQMEDRLAFAVDVPEVLHNDLVPPMVLQLLVENAVKHGVDKLRHGGCIELAARVVGQQLVFRVSNTFAGSNALAEDGAAAANMGIGLVNIRERLRLLYGNNAGLHIEHSEACFVVTLTLPKETLL